MISTINIVYRTLIVFGLTFIYGHLGAQGYFSGAVQLNSNAFLKDARIGAANTPQYEEEIFGGECWIDLQYNKNSFQVGLRLDAFLNSNLLNANDSYSNFGLGKIYLSKSFNKWSFKLGYIYDQIGSGIIFKSYEERPLLIDNALIGAAVTVTYLANWEIKAWGGKQKNLFDFYESALGAIANEGYLSLSENSSIIPGVALLVKRFDGNQIDQLIKSVQFYTPSDSVTLYRNIVAYTFYNTLSWGPVTWYSEWAFKNYDVFFDPDALRNAGGEELQGKFVDQNGSVFYNSVSFAIKNFGLSLEWKRTNNFVFRADPFVALNRGLVNFLPPMSRINTFRLKSRYVPATQEIGEQAFQIDLNLALSKKVQMNQYFSYIQTLDGKDLYREFDMEWTVKKMNGQWRFGMQSQVYNQGVYEGKGSVPLVKTFIPYLEFLHRWKRINALRIETQLLQTKQDYGSWAFILIEYSKAPHWSFAIADMYNYDPKKTEKIHYPRLDIFYSKKSNRFGLSYIKQVEGVVCAGGICRLEPAFSGFRLTYTSNF